MKHKLTTPFEPARRRFFIAAFMLLLSGCAAWSATPERLQTDYGLSVRSMIDNQIYYPEKSRNPDALSPDTLDGMKAETLLKDGYRDVIAKPDEVRKHTSLSVIGSGKTTGSQ
jgi:hypothetical protein